MPLEVVTHQVDGKLAAAEAIVCPLTTFKCGQTVLDLTYVRPSSSGRACKKTFFFFSGCGRRWYNQTAVVHLYPPVQAYTRCCRCCYCTLGILHSTYNSICVVEDMIRWPGWLSLGPRSASLAVAGSSPTVGIPECLNGMETGNDVQYRMIYKIDFDWFVATNVLR